VWDKNIGELSRIATYSRLAEALTKPGSMFAESTQERPYVGRWQA
jgi:hypothetical protein